MTARTGVRLRAMLARWLDATAMERFVDPQLADLQCEYEDAVAAGRFWHSRRIWAAAHIALWRTLVWYGLTRGLGNLLAADDERRALSRTLAAWILFTATATPIFVVPLLTELPDDAHSFIPRLALLLIPQALELVLPFSLMGAILLGLSQMQAALRLRALVMLLAAVSSLGAFLTRDWLVPDSNQAYRELVFEAAWAERGIQLDRPLLAKGLNELTLTELGQSIQPPSDPRDFVSEDARRFAFAPPDSDRSIARQYHGRLAFAWSPLVLACFALTATRRTGSRWWLGTIGLAAAAGYLYLLQWPVRAGGDFLPIAVAAWIPNGIFLLVSIVVSRKALRTA